MKPRPKGGVRVREPRTEPHPPPRGREDERLIQPAELSDDNGDSEEDEPTEDQPAGRLREAP